MVKAWLGFLLLFIFSLHAQEIAVESSINQNQGMTDQALTGSVIVTHPKEVAINVDAFRLDNQKLSVKLVKESRFQVRFKPSDSVHLRIQLAA